MKKNTIILLMIFTCAFAQAQNISTITMTVNKQRHHSSVIKAIRGGFSYMDSNGGESYSYPYGANLSFLYLRTFGESHIYWDAEGGVGTRALNAIDDGEDNVSELLVTAQFLPAIGWRPKISTAKKNYFDVHLGPYAGYDLFSLGGSHIDREYYLEYHYGVAIGAGFWFSRFNLDLTYQRGLCLDEEHDYEIYDTNTLMLRVGYAF